MLTYILLTITTVFLAWVMCHGLPQHRSQGSPAAEAARGQCSADVIGNAGQAEVHPERPGNAGPHPECPENTGPTEETDAARRGETAFAGDRKIRLQGDPRVSRAGFRRGVCLFGIFALLFTVSALRVGIGNDYYKYVEFINRITFDSYVPTEWGFNMLVKLCNILFGPENYMAVFAVIAACTLVIFLSALRHLSADFAVSFFLFMTLGFYFQTLNTIRYYLALAIVLWGLRFLVPPRRTVSAGAVCFRAAARESAPAAAPAAACDYATALESAPKAACVHAAARGSAVGAAGVHDVEQPARRAPGSIPGMHGAAPAAACFHPDYAGFIAAVLAAALFHKSALLAIPMYLLIIVPLKSRRATITTVTIVTLISAAICASALLFRDRYIDLVVLLYPSYANVGPLAGGTSLAGIARCVLALGLGGAALWRALHPSAKHVGESSSNVSRASTAQSSTPLLKRSTTEFAEVNLNTSAARSSAAVSDFASAEAFPDDMALLKVCLLANYYALLLYLFFAFLPQISRLAYFLTVTQLLLVPEAMTALLRRQTVAAEARSGTSQAAQAAPSGTTQEILRPAPHPAGASAHILPRPALALYAAVFLFGAAYFALFLKQASSDEIGIVPYQTWLFTEPRSYEGTWE